jgi:hypothetical protein
MDIFTFLLLMFFIIVVITFMLFSIFYGIPNFSTLGDADCDPTTSYENWKRANNMDV